MKQTCCGLVALAVLVMGLYGCGGGGPSGPALLRCGEGEGHEVEFCRQVDHYEAGFGRPGADVITVDCLVGPEGATVSNQMNGTYYCAGSYKLTSFSTATIELNWGGSTQYSAYDRYEITSPGEGQFSLKVTKIAGGAGNLFLTMSSGSKWMFDTVLVNAGCQEAHPVQKVGGGTSSVKARGKVLQKHLSRVYRRVNL